MDQICGLGTSAIWVGNSMGVGLYGMVGYWGIAFELGFWVEMDCTAMGKMNLGAVLMGGDEVEN